MRNTKKRNLSGLLALVLALVLALPAVAVGNAGLTIYHERENVRFDLYQVATTSDTGWQPTDDFAAYPVTLPDEDSPAADWRAAAETLAAYVAQDSPQLATSGRVISGSVLFSVLEEGLYTSIWTSIGLLLIAAALFLCAYNLWDSNRAAASVQGVLAAMPNTAAAPEEPFKEETAEMPTIMIDGNEYIGTLDFPTLGLTLPVMASWDYDKLKAAPCRYAGTTAGNLVIAGHNYRSHFGRLDNLQPGDTVTFTDVEGTVFAYTVAETEVLQPTAIKEMTGGDWDLTLFTCTLSGQTRLTVRCLKQ